MWGSSELPECEGNDRPIRHCQGEVEGRHVRDALDRGYRFGFVAGGDIHDGRPGDSLDHAIPGRGTYPSGLTAVLAPALSREQIFDAMRARRTYAATESRIYLSVSLAPCDRFGMLRVVAASEEGIAQVCVLRSGNAPVTLRPEKKEPRVVETCVPLEDWDSGWVYARVTTREGNMAWSSPLWAEDRRPNL